VLAYARRGLKLNPGDARWPRTPAELAAAAGQTITRDGLGPAAPDIFTKVLAPACVSIGHHPPVPLVHPLRPGRSHVPVRPGC
jgi:hypothetical protein